MIERILDKLGLIKIKNIYLRYKEQIDYLFWGVLTTVVNWIVYFPLTNLLHVNPYAANVIAWIAAVTFAFITNRTFVFHSEKKKPGEIVKEAALFYAGRLASLGMEEILFYICIDLLHFNENVVKIISNVLVIILNYVISKLIVFKKKDNGLNK